MSSLVDLARAQDLAWVRQFGTTRPGDGTAYAVGADGVVYVAGVAEWYEPGEPAGVDAFLRKYDADGNVSWTRHFGGEHPVGNPRESLSDLAILPDGVIVVGSTYGPLPGQTSLGDADAFVRRYDSDGNELWTRQFGTSAADQGNAVAVEGSDVYVAFATRGDYAAPNRGSNDAVLVKLHVSEGAEVWARQYGDTTSEYPYDVAVSAAGIHVGGSATYGTGLAILDTFDRDGQPLWSRHFGPSLWDEINGLATYGSDLFVVGRTYGLPGQVAAGRFDVFVRRYSTSDGSLDWTHQFGTQYGDSGRGIVVNADAVYVGGTVPGALPGQTGEGRADAYVRALDHSGNELWTHQFGTSGRDAAWAIGLDHSGLVVGGTTDGLFPDQTEGVLFVRKMDLGATELWTRQFGWQLPRRDVASDVASDGSAYVARYASGGGAALTRFDGQGNELWTRGVGVFSLDEALGVAAFQGGAYVVGHSYKALPGFTPLGRKDAILIRFDGSGDQLWADQLGTDQDDVASAVTVTADAVYVAGTTSGTLPGESSAGGEDGYVRKYAHDGTPLWTRQFGTSLGTQSFGIAADPDHVAVVGRTLGAFSDTSSHGGYDAFVRVYDGDGNYLWTRQLGNSRNDVAEGVAVGDGLVFVGGTLHSIYWTTTDGFVSAFDAYGNTAWSRVLGIYGPREQVRDLALGNDGVYAAAGVSSPLPGFPGHGGADALVRSYDAAGNELWTHVLGTELDDGALGIAVGPGGIYVVGTTSGEFPDNTSAGDLDGFLAKFATDAPPVADAGTPQAIHAGQVVTLDGSGSYDDNTAPGSLVYAWTLVGVPPGSAAQLVGADTVHPSFTADLAGTFRASLVVTDAIGQESLPDEVEISSLNIAPVAAAGLDAIAFTGGSVDLDGSASYDADGDALQYEWTIALAPEGSLAYLAVPDSPKPTFYPDVAGDYALRLAVHDGYASSEPDEVLVVVLTNADYAQQFTLEAYDLAVTLDAGQVTTGGNQQAFTTLLVNAVGGVQKGNVQQATTLIQEAIERTDGCALRGAPDGEGEGMDWVLDCGAQHQLYDALSAALSAL